MPLQTGRNVEVTYKKQSGLGVAATGAGGRVFRINSSQGLTLSKGKIRSNESRRDGQTTLGRHGARSVSGGYSADATLGTFDELIADIMRGTWDTLVTITNTQMTSITTTTSTIVAAAGSWITQGLRVGDVVRLTGHSSVANNDRNLRITGLTATTITVAETLTADAVADTSFSLTRPPKLVNPASTVPSYFTFEERFLDIPAGEVFTDVKVGSLAIAMNPDNMVGLTFGMTGRDMEVNSGAARFTTPTDTTSNGLVAVDAKLRLGSGDVVNLTAANINLQRAITTTSVVGALISPDVFDAPLTVTGDISAIREDMTLLSTFLNETTVSLHMLLVDQDSTAPRKFLSIYLPLLTLDGSSKSFGQDGPLIQQIPFEAGKLLTGANADLTMVKFQQAAT
jgi:hypothetical protein